MRQRENVKSPTREMGLGNHKEQIGKGKKNAQYTRFKGRLECPDCGETFTENLIERRAYYWECRNCGYENDVDFWFKRVD